MRMTNTKRTLVVLLVIGALVSICRADLSIEMVLAPEPGPIGGANYPPGYTSWDMMVTTTELDLTVAEIYIQAYTPAAGDFYQNLNGGMTGPPSSAAIGSDPLLEFDTYITMPNYFGTLGAAVDLVGGQRPMTFDDQLLDVAWGASTGTHSGAGTFHVARITVKDGISGTWQLFAMVSSGYYVEVSGAGTFFTSGPLLLGDVDGDGFVGDSDLNIITGNWGLANRSREQGDLSGDGFAGGADYREVLSYWGQSVPVPEEGGPPVPEPATLGFLLAGGLALARRRKHAGIF